MRDGSDTFPAPPGGLLVRRDADRCTDDLPRDVRRVAVARLNAVVIVARRHEDDRLALGRFQHAHDVRRDQRAAREHAEVERLEMCKQRVVALDRHHGFVRRDLVAVVERVHGQRIPVV